MLELEKTISTYLLKRAPNLFQPITPTYSVENIAGPKFGIIGSNPHNVITTTESLFNNVKDLNNPKIDQQFPSGISYILPQNKLAQNLISEVTKLAKAGCDIIILTDPLYSKKDEEEIESLFPEISIIAIGSEFFQSKTALQKPLLSELSKYGPIGILGGMGPFATLFSLNRYFFPEKPTINSQLVSSTGVVTSFGCDIPDRTKYLLDPENNPDPTPFLQRDAATLNKIFKCSVKTITCNTAHAFLPALSQEDKYGQIIDMIKETALACEGSKRVLLTATAGTIEVGLYQKIFNKVKNSSVELLVTNKSQTDHIMEIIYGINGVKTGNIGEKNQKEYAQIISEFTAIDKIIGGCTELPLINQKITLPFIDPMQAAYNACIKEITAK